MKEGWEYKKLGEVATFTRGLTYSKNDEAEISNNIVLRSNNVDLSTGKLNFDELKYLKSEFSIPEEKRVKKGSLLMCMSNGSKIHLGKVALINEDYPYAFGGFMALVTPNEELNPQFFHYSLSSPEYKEFIKKLSEGANINNIKVKELELFTIPIPSLSEQQSIVDYLDSAFAKIDAMKANAEKSLNDAKALFQASLKEMLEPKEGWKEKKLKEVVASITDGDHQPPPKSDDGIPFITISNIDKNSNKIVFGETFYVPKSYYCALKKERIPQQGDVLYTVTGSFGIPVLIDFQKDFCFQRHIALIRPKMGVLSPTYLFYWILSSYATSQAENTATGAAQRTVSLNSLRNFTIHIPTFSTQQSIVAILDSLKSKVDKLQENYDKISQECDALKQAILRQVFE